ncbi:hypothetical protein GYMLUDRAFT_393000 [Collybiopsis luxurians FD-317 M1]|uniref:Uncharacterized protein n=1 Tax=Collybiopsis luxurians FD-317 M1 TaxID=944289 RepID=A0A0D0BB70_9AGAR|nr:hypothetical protein GYMLUDRAFT_393000 [Collybiopsis luxurians FD-317 M1]
MSIHSYHSLHLYPLAHQLLASLFTYVLLGPGLGHRYSMLLGRWSRQEAVFKRMRRPLLLPSRIIRISRTITSVNQHFYGFPTHLPRPYRSPAHVRMYVCGASCAGTKSQWELDSEFVSVEWVDCRHRASLLEDVMRICGRVREYKEGIMGLG